MNRLALIAGGLATALALLLSGCGSSGPSLNGPFGDSAHASNGSQCAWAPPRRRHHVILLLSGGGLSGLAGVGDHWP